MLDMLILIYNSWIFLYSASCICFLLFCLFVVGDGVLCNSGWLQTCHVAENNLLPLLHKCWDFRPMPPHSIYVIQWTKPRALCMLDAPPPAEYIPQHSDSFWKESFELQWDNPRKGCFWGEIIKNEVYIS